MLSLPNLAKELGVTTQTVLNHFHKCVKSHQIKSSDSKISNHIRFFDKSAVKAIRKSFPKQRNSVPNKATLLAKLSDQRALISYLKHDNSDKTSHIKSLSKLLDQQQQLQMSTKRSNDKLISENKHLRAISGTVHQQSGNYSKSSKEPRNHGFLWKLFH